MVERQAEKWPYHDGRRRFTMKTNMDRMRAVLLNRALGFTKEVEVVQPLSPTPGTPSEPGPQQDMAEMRDPRDRDDDGKCSLPPLATTQLTGSPPASCRSSSSPIAR